MQTFRRVGAAYLARLDGPERAVLLDVVEDVLDLLRSRVPGAGSGRTDGAGPLDDVGLGAAPQAPPTDPALRRLLPDASPDGDVAQEFRRFTEADLGAAKGEGLLRLLAAVDAARPDLVVAPAEAPRVAAALTDVRLVVSERLEVRTDADADALYALVIRDDVGAEEATHRLLATVYVVLSLLQESLVDLMLADLGDDGRGPASAPEDPRPRR